MSMYNFFKELMFSDHKKVAKAVFEHPEAKKMFIGPGETSENVASKYGISREAQDLMAFESH